MAAGSESGGGVGGGAGGAFLLIFLGLLATLCVLSAVIFSCADGVSKDKSSQSPADTELYGGGCAAGCGAGCGG